MNIDQIIKQMTLEEKASLCSGRNAWSTKAIERLAIPSIVICDGPHGLRKQPGSGDFLGVNVSVPATCFPPACMTANSWDPDLLRQIGQALGEECLQEQVSILLGPGMNIKRNPLCGRNFEYFSEDPYLTGELTCAYIDGIQSKGIGTSIKHFAANNQETRRMTINTLVDERTLREIYLSAFEQAVKQAQPWTAMAAYNRLNGEYCTENIILLSTILREEWGFEGVVVTDWGACNDRVAGLATGQDLEMPGGGLDNDRRIVEAVRRGTLPMAVLDQTVKRLLAMTFQAQQNLRSDYRYDADAHHQLARKAALQSAVLLKNERNILPLAPSTKLAVIGNLAEQMRYQGSGSSMVNPLHLEQPLDVLREHGVEFSYAPGYARFSEEVDEALLADACDVAQAAERVVVFLGLTELAESEGFDRTHMRLPANQNALMEHLAAVRKDLIVVLFGGSPIEIPWIDQVAAVLHMHLPGQAGGGAVTDLLWGVANPSGKLAETYPLRYEDIASARYFPGNWASVEYRECLFVGYRYFDTACQEVLFPFGHGLSYTSFAYQDLTLSATEFSEHETLQVTVTITNTGTCAGAEIVQLYVHDIVSSVFKAEKELKGFQKILLQPGECRTLAFFLGKRAFAHYDVTVADWVVERGEFEILVGASSRDIRLHERVIVQSNFQAKLEQPKALTEYMQLASNKGAISEQAFAALYGECYEQMKSVSQKSYTLNSTLNDLQGTWIGRLLRKTVVEAALKMVADDKPERQLVARKMLEETVTNTPLRGLAISSGGAMTLGMAEGFAMLANGQFFLGTVQLLRSLLKPGKPRNKAL
ncbi:MAG: glycoside hydrolase family 3 C-terminal domain-containing protein [Ktedonobacteraceae bacterium]|nr:glycoside hydrolase family 3 C-terminal domain-containing protein [Ktedonobacteraceae bacterium]MBO0789543.1 glycoside hydrolase family 3 C-terminal domain-containing protein [Ktedonobacteraceae bacterium]